MIATVDPPQVSAALHAIGPKRTAEIGDVYELVVNLTATSETADQNELALEALMWNDKRLQVWPRACFDL